MAKGSREASRNESTWGARSYRESREGSVGVKGGESFHEAAKKGSRGVHSGEPAL